MTHSGGAGLHMDCQFYTARPALNANQLKLFAVLAMAADHCATLFLPAHAPLTFAVHAIGQLAAPIMCFFIAEGYFHTSNLKRYMGRLLFSAVISHIPYTVCFGFSPLEFWEATSIMWSLFLGLLALTICRLDFISRAGRALATAACCLLAYSANWNYIAVLWILAFGLFHEDEEKKWMSFSAVSLLFLLQFYIHGSTTSVWLRPFVLAAIPLLQHYNHRLGRKSRIIQWSYYLFYPLHFIALYAIRLLTMQATP